MAGPKIADRCKETTTTTGTGTVNLAGAATGFRTLVAGIGSGNTCFYCIAAGSEWEVGVGTVTSGSPDTLSRTTILASSNSGNAVNFSAGTKDVFVTDGANVGTVPGTCGGRLTLTSGTPVTTTDVTAAGTLYFTPFIHNRVALFNGKTWSLYTFSEVSLSLSISSGTNYDVFLYDNAGTLTLETVAWTNDTTRATALATQDGVYVKNGATSRLYLGTIRASGTNTCEDSYGGAHQAGGKRFLWNAYNRVPRSLGVKDTTDSWTYTTATFRQVNNNTGNKVEYVAGLSIEPVKAVAIHAFAGSGVDCATGVGVDSTSANSAIVGATRMGATGGTGNYPLVADYRGYPGIGYHAINWLEVSQASGTTTWYGDQGRAYQQTGLQAEVMA